MDWAGYRRAVSRSAGAGKLRFVQKLNNYNFESTSVCGRTDNAIVVLGSVKTFRWWCCRRLTGVGYWGVTVGVCLGVLGDNALFGCLQG